MPREGSFSAHSSEDDPTAPATRGELHSLAYMLGKVSDRVEEHDGQVDERITAAVRAVVATMPSAVASAMKAVITDRETLTAIMGIVVSVAQQRAAERTGNAIGGLLRSLFTRWLIVGALLAWIAKTAGIDVAAKVWSAIRGG